MQIQPEVMAAVVSGFFGVLTIGLNCWVFVRQGRFQERSESRLERLKVELQEASAHRLETLKADLQHQAAKDVERVKAELQEVSKNLGKRKEVLLRVTDAARQACGAAHSLSAVWPVDHAVLIERTASGLHAIAAFTSTVSSPDCFVYLNDSEQAICQEIVKALTEFFLRLDFERAGEGSEEYVARLSVAATEVDRRYQGLKSQIGAPFSDLSGSFAIVPRVAGPAGFTD